MHKSLRQRLETLAIEGHVSMCYDPEDINKETYYVFGKRFIFDNNTLVSGDLDLAFMLTFEVETATGG